jgi:hypothetical protein
VTELISIQKPLSSHFLTFLSSSGVAGYSVWGIKPPIHPVTPGSCDLSVKKAQSKLNAEAHQVHHR